MKNLRFKFILIIFSVLLNFTAYAQGFLSCPLPGGTPGITGGTAAPFTPNWNNNLPTGQKIIPVVFHLLGGSSALQDNQIQAAVNQLNADFNSANPAWDIDFVLAGIGPRGECTNGITRHPNELSQNPGSFQPSTRWDNARYLNIWVVPLINGTPGKWGVVVVQPSKFNVVNGQIQRTDIAVGMSGAFDIADGVIIKEELIYPNPGHIHTLAHEAGHWLNLQHTFAPCEGSASTSVWTCCHPATEGTTNGDFIADTPPQQNDDSQSNCSLIDHYCADVIPEDLSNFMGYAFSCQNKFTQNQREWMFHCLTNFRPFIWSAENLRCSGITAQSNVVITQPTSWNLATVPTGFVMVKNELQIKNGGSLTIAAGITVQFCDAARAIIEPGGVVQLYGSLTSVCDGRMWKGVEVQGNPSANQYPSNLQGKIITYPGSDVSNAVTGIRAGDTGIGLGGGIIQCTQTTFSNNQRAVQFNPYENHQPIPGAPVTSNGSYFAQCEFITDTKYGGDDPQKYSNPLEYLRFYGFADLLGVRGVGFLGSNFINLRTDFTISGQYGLGIISRESTFYVGDYCTASNLPCPSGNQYHSLFKGLYRGIWANNTDIEPGLPHRYSVVNATFEGCWTGILSSNGSRCCIVSNYFKIGNIPTAAYLTDGYMMGLSMDFGHTNITVQENHFLLDPNAPSDVKATHLGLLGTDIYFIGQSNNIIRKNYYTGLTTGNQAYGEGANYFQSTGLQYLCNTNAQNGTYDFDAQHHNAPSLTPGLREIQGLIAPLTGAISSAGNIFSHVNVPQSDFHYAAGGGIRYFYQSAIAAETPLSVTPPPAVTLVNNADAKQCASILCDRPPCKSKDQLESEKSAIAPAKTQYNNLKSAYLLNPTGPSAPTQKASMTALQDIVQGNTFDIITDIVANENGTLADYRYWLGNMDAYETDLELVRSYVGTGESSVAVSKLNELPSKYQLTGEGLAEFNEYKALLAIVRQHFLTGGNKYTFPLSSITTFQTYAKESLYVRVRGLAKQLLAIYGIFYAQEARIVGFAPDVEDRQMDQGVVLAKSIRLVPNPADQSFMLQFPEDLSQSRLDYRMSVYSIIGASLMEEKLNTLERATKLDISTLSSGTYFVLLRFSTGKIHRSSLSHSSLKFLFFTVYGSVRILTLP